MQNLSISFDNTVMVGASDRLEPKLTTIQALLAKNREHLERFEANPLFSLAGSHLFKIPDVKERFLDCFQVWSDKYQKMVLVRSVFCEDARYAGLTLQHMIEEFGHNNALDSMRNGRPSVWDPILEATANWFPWKILTLGEPEKIVLVHMVVEASATIFYKHIKPALHAENDQHFSHHETVDHSHEKLGLEKLECLAEPDYLRLGEIQSEGWAMLNVVMARIEQLSRQSLALN